MYSKIFHILKYYNAIGYDKTYCDKNIDSEYDNYILINNINEIDITDYNRNICSECFNRLIDTKNTLKG